MNCPTCNASVAPGITFCPECGTRMPAPAPAAPAPPLLQGRYELVQKLGQGGMGAVYLANDRRLSTVRWAVKEMSDAQITSPLDRQQAGDAFKHEAELLARLSHPNLPRVTDHFTENGKNYLVMEFVPGETLAAYCHTHGLPRPLPEVLAWAHQLCDVLGYLHRQAPPVIFRDLKPANVMRTPEGQLRLIDFGIARLFKAGQSRDTQAYGTMGYSAPEQYGRGQTDARSDVYSLGVLLHHLLTGHDPAATPFRLPPVGQLNPAIPHPIAAAIARATDNDPNNRFATIADVQHALLGSGYLVQPQPAVPQQPSTGPTVALNERVNLGQNLASGPYPGSAPLSAPPAATTSLAAASMWIGITSVVWMAIAVLVVIIGGNSGDPENTLSGFGALLGFPPLILGPVAGGLGLVAILRKQTAATARGVRHAGIGIATGAATLILCCALFIVFPSSSASSGARYAIERPRTGAARGAPALPALTRTTG